MAGPRERAPRSRQAAGEPFRVALITQYSQASAVPGPSPPAGQDGRVSEVQRVLDALGSPTRREILWLVWEEELSAGAIATACGVSPATASEHLAVLRHAGLVDVRADGAFRRYRARQETARALPSLLLEQNTKWVPAEDIPERNFARGRTGRVVTAVCEVPFPVEVAFTAFMDADMFSRWLGVPVRITDGRFSCTLEWGTQVRGRYTHVVEPSLIVMRWDFADGTVPVPGRELVAYWTATSAPGGCRIEVHQIVEDEDQAEFMTTAWTMVLGRLVQGLSAALENNPRPSVRAPRSKSGPEQQSS
jgi:DNA-binding transcriptional ArsR family regulator/uncharacterized protein YndB with AHSA1/START domain